MNNTGTPKREAAPEQAMEIWNERLHQLERRYSKGLTLEQLQELADQVSNHYHEHHKRHDRAAGCR